jgi:hypothetical protein
MILDAMVECALANVERFQAEDTRQFVHRLAERLAAVPPDEFTDLDERASFLEIFDQAAAAERASGQERRPAENENGRDGRNHRGRR